ncbi:MAG: DUF4091 domain-containing protein [Saccharolobus sp.]
MNKKTIAAMVVIVVMIMSVLTLTNVAVSASQGVNSNTGTSSTGYSVWVQNSMTHVFENSSSTGTTSAILYGAGNEYVDFQLVITSSINLINVYAKASNLLSTNGNVINASNIQMYLEKYIKVTNVSVNGPYSYLTSPPETYWPDPLPQLYPFNVTPNVNAPIWVDIFIPQSTPQGVYNGIITVTTSNAGSENISISLTVFGFSIPYANTYPVVAGMGVTMNSLKYWGLNTSSLWDYYEVANATYWFLINHRIVPYNPPFGIWYAGWPIKNVSESYFFNNPRVTNFIFPITYNKTIDEENLQYVISNGWLSKAYTYTNDEPALSDYIGLYSYNENITREASYVHSLDPALNFMQTGYTLPTTGPLFNNITTFDFHIERFASNSSWVSYYQNRGKSVWWYSCITPQYPLPEFDLDSYLASEVAISLAQYLYGVNGMLYFSVGADFEWGQNPWINPWEGFNYDPANLDGTLIYPGGSVYNPAGNPYAPVGSIRLDNLRDGIQDYEMLYVLNSSLSNVENQYGWKNINNKQIIDNLITIAVKSLTNYSLNYYSYQTLIKNVAEYIEELNSPVPLIVLSQYGNYNTTIFNNIHKEWIAGYTVPGAYVTINGIPVGANSNGYFNASIPLNSGLNTILVTSNYNGEITTRNVVLNVETPKPQFILPQTFSITPTSIGSELNMSLNQSLFANHLIYEGNATNNNGSIPLAHISMYMTYNSSDVFLLVNYTSLSNKYVPSPYIYVYLAPYLSNPNYDRSFGILWPSNISGYGIITDKNGMDVWGYGWISHPLYSTQKTLDNKTIIAEFTIPYKSLNVTLPFIAVESEPPTPPYAIPEIGNYWGINVEGTGSLYPTYGDWFYEGGNSHRLDYVVFDPTEGMPSINASMSSSMSVLAGGSSSIVSLTVTSNGNPIPFANVTLSSSLGGTFSNIVYDGNGIYQALYEAPYLLTTESGTITAVIKANGYTSQTISTPVKVYPSPLYTGILTGTVNPSNATLIINGSVIPHINSTFNDILPVGSYVISAYAPGYQSYVSQIYIKANGSTNINITLVPLITQTVINNIMQIQNQLNTIETQITQSLSSNITQIKSQLYYIESEITYLNETYHINTTNLQTQIKNIENHLNNLQTTQTHQGNEVNINYLLGITALIAALLALILSITAYRRKPPKLTQGNNANDARKDK